MEENNDPMESLHNDAPISNCICADRDFIINSKTIKIPKEPTIILCATDGCFGYYQSPMHFEHTLHSCLQKAKDEKGWEELVKKEILSVTGDDCSLSLIAVGCKSFEHLKELTKSHSTNGFPQISEHENTIAWAQNELEEEYKKYFQVIAESWSSYKTSYMKYINDKNDVNA